MRWADVDLKRATLSVAQTITTINYRVVIAPPKTDRSRRRNKLDPETVAVLTAHRERQDAERRAAGLRPTVREDLVFANVLGEPPHPDWITARFKVLVSEAGLRPLKGPHALRHTWASLALAEGVHPKVVSDRLGHSTIAITIDTLSCVSRRQTLPISDWDIATKQQISHERNRAGDQGQGPSRLTSRWVEHPRTGNQGGPPHPRSGCRRNQDRRRRRRSRNLGRERREPSCAGRTTTLMNVASWPTMTRATAWSSTARSRVEPFCRRTLSRCSGSRMRYFGLLVP